MAQCSVGVGRLLPWDLAGCCRGTKNVTVIITVTEALNRSESRKKETASEIMIIGKSAKTAKTADILPQRCHSFGKIFSFFGGGAPEMIGRT
jgi:hypothetical protein